MRPTNKFRIFILIIILTFLITSPAGTVSAGTNVWTSNGPEGEVIEALVIDPMTPSTLYAGTYGSGVFKSTNGGGTWEAINNGLTSTTVICLAIDPLTTSTLYAGTWRGGVFKSTNSGGSWIAANNGLTKPDIYALAIDPLTPSTLYAGTEAGGGVFKSTNSGGSWGAFNNGLTNTAITALAIDPMNPDSIYAGTMGGVFKSASDWGWHWDAASNGLTNTNIHSLAIDPLTPSMLYAGTDGGVFKSTNGGGTWSAVNNGLTHIYIYTLVIDPVTPSTVYAGTGGGGVYKSASDWGFHWDAFNAGLTNLYIPALAIDPLTPSIVYAGTHSGVFSIQQTTPPSDQTLTVNKSGTGSGTVTSSPGGINCGSTCSQNFVYNTSVTLSAAASTGSTFSGWSGSGCFGTGTCTVTMDAARSVTATFTLKTYTLSLSKSGTGSGTVTSSPEGINCGSTCSHAFPYNTIVTLAAAPTSPSTFSGWSGAGCSGTGTCTVTMSSARSVTANFNYPGNQTLMVSKSGTGNGTVTSTPDGINCGPTCSHDFTNNTVVMLTATPTSPATFDGWSGSGCSGTGTCTVTMNTARSVTATFTILAACPTITRWKGEYWVNTDLSGPAVLCRDDQTIDMNWDTGSPNPVIPSDGFSARWTRSLEFAAGTYLFHLSHDDGARLYIDDALELDAWATCCVSDITQVALPTGQHTIRLEMFENDGDAYVGLWWEPAIITGWKGEYYNNETLSGNPAIIRDDPAVDFEWGYDSPDPMVLPDHFSARWTTIIPFDPGDYWFALFRDDGIRLKIDDAIALEAWYAGREWVSTVMNMPHGNHTIVVEAFEIDDLASAVFLFGQEINMTYLPLVIR